jgi:integrase
MSITLSKLIQGYIIAAQARRLSPRTIAGYENVYRQFVQMFGAGIPVDNITSEHIRAFLNAHPDKTNRTLSDYHVALSALFTWAAQENLITSHPLENVPRPRPEQVDIRPYSQSDIQAMLGSLSESKQYGRAGQRPGQRHSIDPEIAERNKAIILTLLDTGVRASEWCALNIRDVDFVNRQIMIHHGKGNKSRHVPISAQTSTALWKIIPERAGPDTAVFYSAQGERLTRESLLRIISRIADRAGVRDANIHRFRHTFAIEFLRNGILSGAANPWALQAILGHSDLEMTKRYLHIAQADTQAAHQSGSPVSKWKLK